MMLAVFTAVVAVACLAPLPVAATTKRVLFVGNSFTYVNSLPDHLALVASSLGDEAITNKSVIGGCTLFAQRPSVDNTTASLLTAAHEWDFLVLQDYSALTTVKNARKEYFHPAIQEFSTVLKQQLPNAELVLYQTWSYFNGTTAPCPSSDNAFCFPLGTLANLTEPNCNSDNHYHDEVFGFDCMSYSLARGYLDAFNLPGSRVDRVAPCGISWIEARMVNGGTVPDQCKASIDADYTAPLRHNLAFPLATDPHPSTADIMMYRDNGLDKHPSVAGQYMNALVFYALLFDKSPIGAAVPADAEISADQARGLQIIANSVVRGANRAAWFK